LAATSRFLRRVRTDRTFCVYRRSTMFLIRAPIISLAEEPARSSCSQRCGCSGTVRARRRDR